jgi:hypothetical protein
VGECCGATHPSMVLTCVLAEICMSVTQRKTVGFTPSIEFFVIGILCHGENASAGVG